MTASSLNPCVIFLLADFVIRFITMGLKSMVVIQHKKIIPFRRRVSVIIQKMQTLNTVEG